MIIKFGAIIIQIWMVFYYFRPFLDFDYTWGYTERHTPDINIRKIAIQLTSVGLTHTCPNQYWHHERTEVHVYINSMTRWWNPKYMCISIVWRGVGIPSTCVNSWNQAFIHGRLPKSYLPSVVQGQQQSGTINLWLIVCDGLYLQ